MHEMFAALRSRSKNRETKNTVIMDPRQFISTTKHAMYPAKMQLLWSKTMNTIKTTLVNRSSDISRKLNFGLSVPFPLQQEFPKKKFRLCNVLCSVYSKYLLLCNRLFQVLVATTVYSKYLLLQPFIPSTCCYATVYFKYLLYNRLFQVLVATTVYSKYLLLQPFIPSTCCYNRLFQVLVAMQPFIPSTCCYNRLFQVLVATTAYSKYLLRKKFLDILKK